MTRLTRLVAAAMPLLFVSLLAAGAMAGESLELAKAAQKAGKYEEALAKFQMALRSDPNSTEAALGVAQVSLSIAQVAHKAGKFDDAVPKYQAALKADPASIEAGLGLTQVLSGLGRYDEAIKAGDSARKAHPENAALLVAKSRACLLAAGKAEKAEEPDANFIDGLKLDALKWVNEAIKVDPKCADALVLRGQIALREKDDDQARQLFEQAVAADAKNFDANFELATFWFNRGRASKTDEAWVRASQYFDAAFKIDPTSGQAALGVARGLGHQKAPKKDVVAMYLKAVELLPGDEIPLSQAYQWTDRADRVATFEKLAAAQPKDVTRKIYYAYALMEHRDHELALGVLDEASKLDPKNPFVAVNKGDVKLAWGKVDDAIASYGEAMDLFNGKIDDKTFAKIGYDVGFKNKGLTVEQRDKLWTMLWKHFPDRYALMNDVGLYYRDTAKNNDKSLEWYLRAAEVATEDVCVQNDTGLIYHYNFHQFDKAEPYYRRAIAIGKEQSYDPTGAKDPDRGYRDAIDNMVKMLIEQKRWDDLEKFCTNDVPEARSERAMWLQTAKEKR